MKIGFNPESIVDISGKPLAGRVTMYLHDSDVKLDVFTMEGEAFVQAQNPQLLNNAGRLDATLFFEAAIVDVKVERYVGPEGQMSVDSPDTDFEPFDYFETGFDPRILSVRSCVDTISELMDTSPDSQIVDVIGYYGVGDCAPRTYYWDADSQNDVDGGYVIGSNVSDSGRWILLWDDEVIPSSVYGILPGSNEANISAILSYPATVGSFLQKTAPCVRFEKGKYTTNVSLSTEKELCFDSGAYFRYATITCPRLKTFGKVSSYLGDFNFTGANAEAHSAWFRTVNAFWHCGANTFHLDVTNYFQDAELNTSVDLLNKVIIGCKRLPMTYATGAYLQIRGCGIYGHRIFSPTEDIIRFRDMCFDQEWFTKANFGDWDFGLLSQGHRIQLITSDGNTIDYANFWQPDVYLRACLGNGDTTFDGHELPYSTTTNDQFTTIRNCRFNSGTHFTDSKCNNWENVTVTAGIEFTGASLSRTVIMNGCKFGLSAFTSTGAISHMTVSNCEVSNGGTWNVSDTALDVYDSRWAPGLTLSETAKTARTHNKSVNFTRTVFTDNGSTMWINDITLQSCTCCEHIYLVPYYEDSKFKHNCVLRDNRFIGNFRLDVAPKDMVNESDVFHTYCTLVIENNRFEQSDGNGVWLPYVTNNGDWAKLYVESGIGSTFFGNTGNCPKEKSSRFFDCGNMTDSFVYGSITYKLLPSYYHERVWNLLPDVNFLLSENKGVMFEKGPATNPWDGNTAESYWGTMMHVARFSLSDAKNDQFLVTHSWNENHDFAAGNCAFMF